MKLEVLVTTMHQKDISKYYEMNLQTNAVIANQSDSDFIQEKFINGSRVKLVTTSTRGTSKNRNIAINNISDEADYVIFSDDDLKFHDGYENIILSEFEKHPEADAIKFNIKCISERKISMKPITEFKKANRRAVTSYGVWALVIKKDVLLNSKLFFNERFGPGTENYCGEDSIFLQKLFNKKVALYVSPLYVAEIDQSDSSWFEGHNEKFFTVGGMIINECYPLLSWGLVIRSAIKAYRRKTSDLSFLSILNCYYKGIVRNIKQNWRKP